MMAKRWIVLIIALFLLLGVSGSAFGITPFKITSYVTDQAGLLSEAERSELADRLSQYADSTGNQILLVTIPSLDNQELTDFTEQLFSLNKPGQKGKDNGLIFLVALKEHQVRLEVGYGLEGVLPDGKAGAIIREQVTPFFKNNDYSGGLSNGINTVISTISPQYTVAENKPLPVRQSGKRDRAFPFAFLVAIVIFFISFLGNIGRSSRIQRSRYHRGYSEPWYWGGGGGGSGFSGGGGFGGSDGGFSGGGGSFGGGGSSGSW
jgi:uncharacterized protein